MSVVVASLLLVAVAAGAVTVVGMLAVPDASDRLHLLGPAQTIGAVALALAVLLHAGPGEAAVKATLALAVVFVTGPVTTHALGRAALVRRDRAGAAATDETPRIDV